VPKDSLLQLIDISEVLRLPKAWNVNLWQLLSIPCREMTF